MNTNTNAPIIGNNGGPVWYQNTPVKRQNFPACNSDFQPSDVTEILNVDSNNACGNSLQNSSSGCSSKSSTAGSSSANSPPQNLLLPSKNGQLPNILNHSAVAQLQQAGMLPTGDKESSLTNSRIQFSGGQIVNGANVQPATNTSGFWTIPEQNSPAIHPRPSESGQIYHPTQTTIGNHSLSQQNGSANQGLAWAGIPNFAAMSGLCGTPGNTNGSPAGGIDPSQLLTAAALAQGQYADANQQQLLRMYLRGQQPIAAGAPTAAPAGAIPLLSSIPNSATTGASPLSYLAAQNNSLGLTNLLANAHNGPNPSSLNTGFNPQAMALSMYYLDQMNLANQLNLHLAGSTFGIAPIQNPITNVAYMNEKGQLLESLPICRDFKAGKCHRHSECRYVHLIDDNVEVNQGRVTICRDAAKGRCTRTPCKYFHIPPIAITASRSLALANSQTAYMNPQNSYSGSANYLGTPGSGTASSMLYCEPSTLNTATPAHI